MYVIIWAGFLGEVPLIPFLFFHPILPPFSCAHIATSSFPFIPSLFSSLRPCTHTATLGGTLASLVNEAQAAGATGGKIIPLLCDHSQDAQVQTVLAHIKEKEGKLHYLVNNAFALPASGTEGMVGVPFWEQGTEVCGKQGGAEGGGLTCYHR